MISALLSTSVLMSFLVLATLPFSLLYTIKVVQVTANAAQHSNIRPMTWLGCNPIPTMILFMSDL